jgi:uncharacterized protein (TIGR02646 family)
MIPIIRGNEPPELKALRSKQLAAMTTLRRQLKRDPTAKEIDGYQAVKPALFERQYGKCCYCERWYTPEYNDVEHYRPKGSANRTPGSNLTHGYWWLAWNWNNLLFACPMCNRSSKNDQFPLEHGSKVLRTKQQAPGHENPLLLDPASGINPVEHIVYSLRTFNGQKHTGQWWATARNGSQLGSYTIAVCDLNHSSQRDLRDKHYKYYIAPRIAALTNAMLAKDSQQINTALNEALAMLVPANEYVALKYDAFRHFIPSHELEVAIGLRWPEPATIGW